MGVEIAVVILQVQLVKILLEGHFSGTGPILISSTASATDIKRSWSTREQTPAASQRVILVNNYLPLLESSFGRPTVSSIVCPWICLHVVLVSSRLARKYGPPEDETPVAELDFHGVATYFYSQSESNPLRIQ